MIISWELGIQCWFNYDPRTSLERIFRTPKDALETFANSIIKMAATNSNALMAYGWIAKNAARETCIFSWQICSQRFCETDTLVRNSFARTGIHQIDSNHPCQSSDSFLQNWGVYPYHHSNHSIQWVCFFVYIEQHFPAKFPRIFPRVYGLFSFTSASVKSYQLVKVVSGGRAPGKSSSLASPQLLVIEQFHCFGAVRLEKVHFFYCVDF